MKLLLDTHVLIYLTIQPSSLSAQAQTLLADKANDLYLSVASLWEMQIKVQITARIKPGWHLYALDEIPKGPRPTRIWLPAAQPFALAGEIQQPVPIMKFDENFGVETQFYQGSVTFLVPLKIAGTAPPGTKKLILQTRYQTCNEHLFLPPKTVQLEALLVFK